jgi:hypothetical protein
LAFYIHTLGGGGVQRVFVNLTQGFVRRGYTDLWLIANRAQGPMKAYLPPNVHIIDLCEPDVPFRFARLLRYLSQKHANSPWLNSATKAHYIALKAIGYLRKRHADEPQISGPTPKNPT